LEVYAASKQKPQCFTAAGVVSQHQQQEAAAKFFSACRFWGLTGKLEHVNLALAPLYPSTPFYPVFFLRRFVGPSFPVLPSLSCGPREVILVSCHGAALSWGWRVVGRHEELHAVTCGTCSSTGAHINNMGTARTTAHLQTCNAYLHAVVRHLHNTLASVIHPLQLKCFLEAITRYHYAPSYLLSPCSHCTVLLSQSSKPGGPNCTFDDSRRRNASRLTP
jgi:hypothetical protein